MPAGGDFSPCSLRDHGEKYNPLPLDGTTDEHPTLVKGELPGHSLGAHLVHLVGLSMRYTSGVKKNFSTFFDKKCHHPAAWVHIYFSTKFDNRQKSTFFDIQYICTFLQKKYSHAEVQPPGAPLPQGVLTPNRRKSTNFDKIRHFSTIAPSWQQGAHEGGYYDPPSWVTCDKMGE